MWHQNWQQCNAARQAVNEAAIDGSRKGKSRLEVQRLPSSDNPWQMTAEKCIGIDNATVEQASYSNRQGTDPKKQQ